MVYFKLLTDEPGELLLRTAEGEPIAASIRTIANDRVFVPDEPIASGTLLVLEYTSDCGIASEYSFIAAPHGELELRPAALVIDEQGTKFPEQLGELSFVRVRYFSPDVNGLGESLMSHRFTVDGNPAELVTIEATQLIQVAAACRPVRNEPLIDTCGILREVKPGLHRIVATTTIVGQATQPEPVALEVEVQCPGELDPQGTASETDVDEADDGGDFAGDTNDGTAADDSPPPLLTVETGAASTSAARATAPGADASGCTLVSGMDRRASTAGAFAAALAALAVARRGSRAHGRRRGG